MTPRGFSPATIGLLAAGVGTMLLPPDAQGTVRLAIGEVFRPGCLVWRLAEARFHAIWCPPREKGQEEVERLRQELAISEEARHRLELQLARLQEVAAANRPPLFGELSAPASERLLQPVLMEAAVLGRGRWLDGGSKSGFVEEAPLLKSDRPLIDLGRDTRVSPEDLLLLGRSIIGKVHRVGRWTSTFLLVTDPEFRGRAQLVRETREGYVFGAKGVLRGQGNGVCILEGIPATETVEAGDLVYTADRDGFLPTPLYYGEVAEATLEESARAWRIRVKPVERPVDLTKVQVVRTSFNPRRALAN